jgi:hypothetical protein
MAQLLCGCCFGVFLMRHGYSRIPWNFVTIAEFSWHGTVLILPTVVESFAGISLGCNPHLFCRALTMMILWSQV